MFQAITSQLFNVGFLDAGPRRPTRNIDTVMLHRIGPTLGPAPAGSAVEIAAWFREHPEVLGTTMMPYTFVIPPDGKTEQAVWVSMRTPHGRSWNTRAIGVALVGDFRRQPPTDQQVDAAAALVIRLQDALRHPLAVYGHTMWHPLPHQTTTTPGKDCPGKHFEAAYREILAQVKACGQVHLGI